MKNRTILKIAAVIIPVISISIIIGLLLNFRKKKEKTEALKNIPTFSLTKIDNTLFNSQSLVNTQTKVFIYFSPSCHYCQAEAEDLSKTYHLYQNIQWIWVASEPIREIKEFAHQYNLDKRSNIHWCHDERAAFYQKLGMSTIPYFLVYNQNNHLIKRNSGAIKLEKLLLDTLHERK
ncbi:TlpA family protein disulfide reductase [Chryseobacterium sp. G0186]|uniref:TlpA family protein disulfide reductase n=1 Tax=Chryseobacterium sp. G0186 TaxID=2487064 RepID=UPI0013DDA43D|nr:redoxin family protein [Chryseobacterium sp. G0186]